jgi:hypothetical protein
MLRHLLHFFPSCDSALNQVTNIGHEGLKPACSQNLRWLAPNAVSAASSGVAGFV